MRILAVITLLLVTGCANTPRVNPPPQVTADKSWIPDDAIVYGQDGPHGFFRLVLNQSKPEQLGNSVGFLPEALLISPDKSEVYADANGPGTIERHYLYDAKTGMLRNLSELVPPFSFPEISPDWHYIVWTNFRNPGVHIIDLRSSTERTIQLPGLTTPRDIIIGAVWSSDENVLVTRHSAVASWAIASWTFWKIDSTSGVVTQIDGQNRAGTLSYMESGRIIGVSCPLCEGTRPKYKIETPLGAVAYVSADHDLIVKDRDGSLNIVERHVPPQPMLPSTVSYSEPHGEYPALWTIFDGDVVLYSFGRELRVYGIAEHKKLLLRIAPIELVF